MGCPHASGCPLFPYLNASVGAWRDSYCDHANGWRGCARYLLSGQGRPVPLALLPNGRMPVSMLPPSDPSAPIDMAHHLRVGVVPQEQDVHPLAGLEPDHLAARGTADGGTGLRPLLRRRRAARRTTGPAPALEPAPEPLTEHSTEVSPGLVRLPTPDPVHATDLTDIVGPPTGPRPGGRHEDPVATVTPAHALGEHRHAPPGRPEEVDLRDHGWRHPDWHPTQRPSWWHRMRTWLRGTA